MNKYEALRHFFGYSSFRGGQEKLIDAILGGHDALGIMPTGGGKSMCYQIPALLFDGITVVISPLISLMKDQVMSLKEAGVSAAFLNSSLSPEQIQKVYHNLYEGTYKILYVAPERLESDEFLELAQSIHISLIAVDEAHCISQWGNDFRPGYLKISYFVTSLPVRPVLAAFTATATDQVRLDIEEKLCLKAPIRIITGFDRPNLNFEVMQPQRKSQTLLELLQKRNDKSGIVYCSTRSGVEKIYSFLQENGFSATRYHAGLSDIERRQNQDDFIYDRKPIMVATNAFGMGIDKSNVSFVVHYNMPMSLEAYYQEAGRAGRDGEAADCILLYSASDIHTAKMLIESSDPSNRLSAEEQQLLRRRDYERLNRMIDYCKTTNCLRGNILDYFGQSHVENCENCGNCRTVFLQKDITIEAQKILSCVKRIHDRLGYSVGVALVTRVLHGSNDQRILAFGLNELSTYGLMKELSLGEIRDMIAYLEDRGYLHTDEAHGGILLTTQAHGILFKGERLTMRYKELPQKEAKRKDKRHPVSVLQDPNLYETLRELRTNLANQQNIPAYIVFSNATLADMAVKKPLTMTELMNVSGVGNVKAQQYGEIFLSAIRKYMENE